MHTKTFGGLAGPGRKPKTPPGICASCEGPNPDYFKSGSHKQYWCPLCRSESAKRSGAISRYSRTLGRQKYDQTKYVRRCFDEKGKLPPRLVKDLDDIARKEIEEWSEKNRQEPPTYNEMEELREIIKRARGRRANREYKRRIPTRAEVEGKSEFEAEFEDSGIRVGDIKTLEKAKRKADQLEIGQTIKAYAGEYVRQGMSEKEAYEEAKKWWEKGEKG